MAVLLASLPLLVALAALAVFQRGARQAGLATFVSAVGLALLAPGFTLPAGPLLVAVTEGLATSLLVLTVLLPGLLLFRFQEASGGMDILARCIRRLGHDRDRAVLLLVLGLAPFVEAISGFGVAIVVVVPIFRALGLSAWQAARLGALGQVAIPWGALAVGTLLGAELTSLDAGLLGARTALLTALLPVLYGLAALAIASGRAGPRRHWPVALLGGLSLSAGAGAFSLLVGVELAGVLASSITLGLLAAWRSVGARSRSVAPTPPSQGPSLSRALAPYLLLTLLLLLTRLVTPQRLWLQNHAVLIEPAINLRLPLLYLPGTWLLVTCLLAAPLLGLDATRARQAMTATWRQFVPAAIAVASFLAAAQVMRASGMTATLGGAAAGLGSAYLWLAPWLGALGGWLTGSNAGGNAMFALLQAEAAARAGLPLEWVIAAQNSAASHATMISPARLILAALAAGLPGGEGRLMRAVGPVVLLAIALITASTWLASR